MSAFGLKPPSIPPLIQVEDGMTVEFDFHATISGAPAPVPAPTLAPAPAPGRISTSSRRSDSGARNPAAQALHAVAGRFVSAAWWRPAQSEPAISTYTLGLDFSTRFHTDLRQAR